MNKIDWVQEAQRVESEGKLVAKRMWKRNGVPRGARRALVQADKEQVPVALVYDDRFGHCVIVTQGQGPVLDFVEFDPTKRCKQCLDPNLKGIHTCGKRKKTRSAAVSSRSVSQGCLCDWCRGRDFVRGPDCKSRRGFTGEQRKTLRVVVEGSAGIGKTTIMLAIAKAMRNLGFKGNVEDEDHTDEALVKLAAENHKRVRSLLRHGIIIEVRTKQVPRPKNKKSKGIW